MNKEYDNMEEGNYWMFYIFLFTITQYKILEN